MKLTRLLSASALSLLLGTTTLVFAQEQHEDAKPQDEPRPEASKPAQDDMKAPKQNEAKPQKQDEKDKDKDKSEHNDKAKQNDMMKQDDSKTTNRMKQGGQENQRAERGGRIPDDKFRAHFGRQHTFKVSRVNNGAGQPRFQYGGYTFTIVDAWPAGWAYTDDCYINYIDGEYFLFDLLHPGVQVAVVVVL